MSDESWEIVDNPWSGRSEPNYWMQRRGYDERTEADDAPDEPRFGIHNEEEGAALCDLLNAGEQARSLAAAVAGIGRFRVRKLDTGRWCAVQSFASGTKGGFGDTPAAVIVALWQAVQATGEGE